MPLLFEPSELWTKWDKPVTRTPVAERVMKAIVDRRQQMLEEVIGPTAEFLPVSFLELGYRRCRAVARVQVRMAGPQGLEVQGCGTGFLVAQHLLMTNHHVLPDVEHCRDSLVQFKYEVDALGQEVAPDEWALAPERFFVTSPFEALDFTIVALASKDSADAGALYGTIPLRAERGKISLHDDVNIAQHPSGRRKEVVLRENKVTAFFEGGFVHYTADTLPGSSGAPVFNNQWDLVALHHRGVIRRDESGEPIMVDGSYECLANEGIRISEIIASLRPPRLDSAAATALAPFIYA